MDTWVEEQGSLDGYPDAQHVSNSDLLELPCDILVLAALEDQVTDNVGRIDAKMVAEGANGPTTVEADAILAERGIVVLPDILTNAGGVTVSYFGGSRISVGCSGGGTIREKLAEQICDAFDRVWDLSDQLGVTLRQAALVAAIREVAGALTARGIYP